jgi:hypothetical protein
VIERIKNSLFSDLQKIISDGKTHAVAQVNSTVTLIFWQVGNRINSEILAHKRAAYAKEVIPKLANKLVAQFGKSFETRNLRRMMQFAEVFSDFTIVSPLATQLSWSHFIELLPLKTEEARNFYCSKAAEETWSRNELRRQIERKTFERKEIAQIQLSDTNNTLSGSFKDPYFFDFLDLKCKKAKAHLWV